jgi:hypothetical protein
VFSLRNGIRYGLPAAFVALAAWMIATCSGGGPVEACPQPVTGSPQERMLQRVRDEASFPVLYPCSLPLNHPLINTTLVGQPGRQQAELVFQGAFDLTIRQAQFPPAMAPDPTGASRRTIDLFPNVRATLIERNDGSGHTLYHYFWQRNGIYYELQAVGPALQERTLRQVATSLE